MQHIPNKICWHAKTLINVLAQLFTHIVWELYIVSFAIENSLPVYYGQKEMPIIVETSLYISFMLKTQMLVL